MHFDFIKNHQERKQEVLIYLMRFSKKFLENDIESLLRSHVRTMGIDIELTRKFGSSSMDDLIKQVEVNHNLLMRLHLWDRVVQSKCLKNDLRDVRV